MLQAKDIFEYLPHRYPFLLVDRVEEIQKGEFIKCYKNVSVNEPQFTGHFPDSPIYPGVMIIESMAQATGLLAFETMAKTARQDALYLLVGVDKARFKQPVVPGDRLDLYAEVVTGKRGIWKFNCRATVDDKEVASAIIMCAERKKSETT